MKAFILYILCASFSFANDNDSYVSENSCDSQSHYYDIRNIIVPEIDITKIIHEGRSGQKTNEDNLVTKKFLSDDPVTECSGILHELNLFFGFLLPFPDKTDKNLKKLRAKAECSDATLVKSLKTNLNYTNNDRK